MRAYAPGSAGERDKQTESRQYEPAKRGTRADDKTDAQARALSQAQAQSKCTVSTPHAAVPRSLPSLL